MRYYNLVIGKEKVSFKVPTSWSEVSHKKYCDYVEVLGKSVEGNMDDLYKKIYELFTDLGESYWSMNLDASVFYNIDADLSFIGKEPMAEEMPTDIKIDDKFYPISEDFMNLSIGRYRDIMNIIEQSQNLDRVGQVRALSKMIAVIACDDYETEQDLERIALDVEKMPCDDIASISGFFLSKLNRLKSGTSQKQSEKASLTTVSKLVTERLLKIMAFFIRCIISPTKTLQSTRKYLTKKCRACIGLSNYKVVSVTQSKDMLT